MTDPPFAPGVRLAPPDARRGGLIIVGAQMGDPALALCRGFSDQGYEVWAPFDTDDVSALESLFEALAPPVVLLAIASELGWAAACRPSRLAAASLFDPPLKMLDSGKPLRPACLHFATGAPGLDASILEALRERLPEVPVYPYPVKPGFIWGEDDAARLARLRTLQLFHRAAGARDEMGG